MPNATCTIDGCDRPQHNKRMGWCGTHYMRWHRHGDPLHGGAAVFEGNPTGVPCSIDGCAKLTVARTYCENHYRRWKRYGHPTAGRTAHGLSPEQRFWPHVDKTDTCWLWTASVNNSGYGTIKVGAITHGVHQYSLILAGHEIPPGMDVDHLCRVRRCVNPDHLEIVTRLENVQRAWRRIRKDRADAGSVGGSGPGL